MRLNKSDLNSVSFHNKVCFSQLLQYKYSLTQWVTSIVATTTKIWIQWCNFLQIINHDGLTQWLTVTPYFFFFFLQTNLHNQMGSVSNLHSSGAVWELRWPSWAVRPNKPSGFRGRKAILNHALALVSACP